MGLFLKLCRRKNVFNFFIRQLSGGLRDTVDVTMLKTPGIRKESAIQKALYGGKYMVTMIPGSTVGQELMDALQKVFTFSGAPINFEIINIENDKEDLEGLNNAVTSIIRNGVGIKGMAEVDYNKHLNLTSRDLVLRNSLDLYVNVLKCHMCGAVHSRHKELNLVIIRQNTEGEYSMLEHQNVKGTVENLKIVTRTNSERIARFAFDYAKKNNRKKVTIIHKADMFQVSDGLFLNTCKRVAAEFPDVAYDDMLVDACCLQLVVSPQQFDVMIMTNLYGTVITNVVMGITNGSGLLSSRNYGERSALFEPALRFCEASLAGKNAVNPVMILNAGVDMLHHLGLTQHADIIHKAIKKTICEDCVHTPDLGGNATTSDVLEHIMNNISHSIFVQK